MRAPVLRHLGGSAAGRLPRVSGSQAFATEAVGAVAAPPSHHIPASIAAIMSASSRLVVSPAPTMDAIITTLRMRASDVCRDDRALRIYGAALYATPEGRPLLFETLRLDLSAELLGFLIDAEELRGSAEAWLAEVILIDGESDEETPVRDMKLQLLKSFSVNLNLLVVRYLDFGAPHFVSVGADEVRALLGASRSLAALVQGSAQGGVAASRTAALEIVEGALVALYNAELEVFEQMVSEPLEWGIGARPEVFDAWAAQTVSSIQTQTALAALVAPAQAVAHAV